MKNSDLILLVVLQKNAVHNETVIQNGEFNGGILAIYTHLVSMCLSIRAVNPQVHTSKKNGTRRKTGRSHSYFAFGCFYR